MNCNQKVECILFLIITFWITHGNAAKGHYYETIDDDMDIYGDIERALYFDGSKIDMKHFIADTFDFRNSNPTYSFVLPDDQERRIIMRRSDFRRPIFPNITEINMKLSRVAAQRSVEREQSGGNPVRVNKLTAGPPPPAFNDIEDMAAQNVQTERNFIEYMHRLNQRAQHFMTNIDGDQYRRHDKEDPSPRKKIRPKKVKPSTSFPLMVQGGHDWDEFGLSGWGGEIISPRAFHGEVFSEKPPDTDVALVNAKLKVKDASPHSGSFTPMQWSFLDRHDHGENWDLPGKIQRRDYTPIMDEINDVYSVMKNIMNTTVSPEWPITNPRSAHRNEDVYIARANDPFGYSTKWEYRSSTSGSRKKRGFGELYSMIKCSTGCDPLLLKGYGCYCGFLGSGYPADGIDRCCQAHDQCYGRANCPKYLQYFIPYIWKCYNGRPLCAVDNGEWGHCATQLCKCDLSLSACARRYRCPQRRQVCHSNRIRMIQNYLKII